MTAETEDTNTDTDNVIQLRPHADTEKILRQKWKSSLDGGFAAVPSVLIHSLQGLRIRAPELAVLVCLIDLWWLPADMPWPSKAKIAERLGVSPKTVQRAIKHLCDEGLIKSEPRHRAHGGQTSNRYDMSPLVVRLEAIMKDLKAAKKAAEDLKRKAVRKSAPKAARISAAS